MLTPRTDKKKKTNTQKLRVDPNRVLKQFSREHRVR